jgi:adenylate kinase
MDEPMTVDEPMTEEMIEKRYQKQMLENQAKYMAAVTMDDIRACKEKQLEIQKERSESLNYVVVKALLDAHKLTQE